ncbi:AAA family ATPase [Glaciecola sp. 1036]|uniref:AAA family ATPase n=1 Tax=Alteromonadaceae TaxID=72275 RepID=UPI003CFC8131
MLDFLEKSSLTTSDFNAEAEFLIPDFLAKNMITMIYADGGNGKSWLGFSLAKYCASLPSVRVTYLDFDNPLTVLKERQIDKQLIEPLSNLLYVQRSKCEMSPSELLGALQANAIGKIYENHIFIIDSLRDFTDVDNNSRAMVTMEQLKDIREAGGTLVVLHHSNKDGRNYQGSNNIRNSVDNMFQLRKLELSSGIGVLLICKKERCAIRDKAFDIDPKTFNLTERDVADAKLTQEDVSFVSQVKEALTQQGELNKSALLESCGFTKDDKTARSRLEKYENVYWKSEKRHTRIFYTLID